MTSPPAPAEQRVREEIATHFARAADDKVANWPNWLGWADMVLADVAKSLPSLKGAGAGWNLRDLIKRIRDQEYKYELRWNDDAAKSHREGWENACDLLANALAPALALPDEAGGKQFCSACNADYPPHAPGCSTQLAPAVTGAGVYEAPRDTTKPLRVRGIGRVGDEPRAVLVLLDQVPTDDEMRSCEVSFNNSGSILNFPTPKPADAGEDENLRSDEVAGLLRLIRQCKGDTAQIEDHACALALYAKRDAIAALLVPRAGDLEKVEIYEEALTKIGRERRSANARAIISHEPSVEFVPTDAARIALAALHGDDE